ncbi:MAG: citramalate synthase [Candidatus Gastranaerophilales bacterium]|nr:citramalate synthase [Candidatus Gastranaerophilales bacterium]
MTKIEIYDTTLRDGAQAEGIAFSVNDKLKIIKLLDELGVTYIEAGWPGANPKDIEVFNQIKSLELKNAEITAFGCTRKTNSTAAQDNVLNMLVEADTKIITIFGKCWDFQVKEALCTTLEENLNMIKDSIEYLISKGKTVFFDAEHFFDGYKSNPQYALLTVKTAHEAGAERIVLCDTNGGCINTEIYKIIKAVQEGLPNAKIAIHAHNDGDVAVANSIAAVEAGAIQVQGTINGYGERCGNANLCSIIPNLQLKMGRDVIGQNIEKLVHVSRKIDEIANKKANEHAPFVGRSAFAHKAGIHASGVIKNSNTYEHISPESIGNARRILVSDQAGTASIKEKLNNLRLGATVSEDYIPKIIEHIKTLENEGFTFENADASFEIMLLNELGQMPKYFEIKGFRVITDTTLHAGEKFNSEASVKIQIGQEIIHTVSEGDGPVHALDNALRKALSPVYPEIKKFQLADFKVRILDSTGGTGAKTRVQIETSDGYNRWDTVGVSDNVVEAAYLGIVDSILFGLLLNKIDSKSEK